MLDKKMIAVLAMLSQQVGYSYKVVKKAQLLANIPKKYAMDMDTLVAIIAFLREMGYAVVKCQDKDDICLTLTVRGEAYLAGKKHPAVKSQITNKQVWILFLGVFFASLLGAFVAVLLGKLF